MLWTRYTKIYNAYLFKGIMKISDRKLNEVVFLPGDNLRWPESCAQFHSPESHKSELNIY